MSDLSVIPAQQRKRAGKGAARATRRAGLVPGVVYGGKKAPVMIAMDPRIVWKGLEGGHFFSTVYTIDVKDGTKEKALARDVQFHPVTDQPQHVDFVRVSAHDRIHVMVPVRFLNDETCPGVELGGLLNVVRHELELICSADNVPQEVECDMGECEIGDTMRLSDIALPEGVESAIADRDPVVANVVAPKIEEEPSEAEEGDEEGEESEESEAEVEEASEDDS